jgi:hypothetical protein
MVSISHAVVNILLAAISVCRTPGDLPTNLQARTNIEPVRKSMMYMVSVQRDKSCSCFRSSLPCFLVHYTRDPATHKRTGLPIQLALHLHPHPTAIPQTHSTNPCAHTPSAKSTNPRCTSWATKWAKKYARTERCGHECGACFPF